MMDSKFCFAIDRGGTFTDVYARCPGNKVCVLKLLSEDPNHYKDAPTEGIRRVIENELKIKMPTAADIDTSIIGWIRMGTTVATNALLERRGTKMALAITKGFKDLLYIGNQARPDIFDLAVECPEVLYETVIEVDERIIPSQGMTDAEMKTGWRKVISSTGEDLVITKEVDQVSLRRDLTVVHQSGIDSLAVLLLHSYVFNEHELLVKKVAEDIGFKQVSISSHVMPMVKAVPRGYTACSDAYLTPHIKSYLKDFRRGFHDELNGVNVLFMQSDGGLTKMDNFMGSRAILSGPAGGVVGCAMTAYDVIEKQPVIGFDMGGTSTDVSRFAGQYEHVFESTTAGITLQAPQLDINTVAAGGGSRLFYRSEMFVVGPESVGAHPGPVCYKNGGNLAVTDANLALGRLLPKYFPKIFGPNENEALDSKATLKAFDSLLLQINDDRGENRTLTVENVAMGFIRVANEAMCRPIRALTQGKGYDTSRHVLAVFGGAGGQHACAVARSLGMSTVFIHKYSGILSAFGMALADVVHEAQEPCAKLYNKENVSHIESRLDHLVVECQSALKAQGFDAASIKCECYLNLRYEGTDCALMCTSDDYPIIGGKYGDFEKCFVERYKQEFGFEIRGRPLVVDDVRVRGVGRSDITFNDYLADSVTDPVPETVEKVYFDEGFVDTNIYLLNNLFAGDTINGPALIIDQIATILVEPGCMANISKEGNVVINIGEASKKHIGCELDSIQLSIFSHRFMSIAEQMGRILQRTSISTNIKERLDFSCALFGPDGGLVSNAPHIPVHLGAMQQAVQYQLKTLGENMNQGDVILSNHPSAGGSHLPDLTVITPVFYRGVKEPVFYVASRGHHADIGGSTPGSMPPYSTSIYEEGAVFHSFKLVEAGVFQETKLIEKLNDPGKYPGCSGTRNLQDNLSDLKAQIAANTKGIKLVNELIDYYGLEVIQSYMTHIQSNAEKFVKQLLIKFASEVKRDTGLAVLAASDYMDDGSIINLVVSIDENIGTAVFDFGGTGPEVWGNCNAPKAVTISAIIYCLRAMVGYDIPLNQGCLNPVEIRIPENSILNPSDTAAVVGGNVETSQRVVDVILKAFGACAASQGCMNNVTFGDENVGYYETIAGGAGAGPTWNGRSGIHTHMTNTRITDPEILENRYPITLTSFCINPNTGGNGKYRGGDGVIREMLFRKKLTLSIITERRVFQPYGLKGGSPGCKGQNLLIRQSRTIRLPSKTSVNVDAGDILRLETPGGGGYGTASDNSDFK